MYTPASFVRTRVRYVYPPLIPSYLPRRCRPTHQRLRRTDHRRLPAQLVNSISISDHMASMRAPSAPACLPKANTATAYKQSSEQNSIDIDIADSITSHPRPVTRPRIHSIAHLPQPAHMAPRACVRAPSPYSRPHPEVKPKPKLPPFPSPFQPLPIPLLAHYAHPATCFYLTSFTPDPVVERPLRAQRPAVGTRHAHASNTASHLPAHVPPEPPGYKRLAPRHI